MNQPTLPGLDKHFSEGTMGLFGICGLRGQLYYCRCTEKLRISA